MPSTGSAPTSRRERQRAATVTEIKTTARNLLVEQGQEAVTLRAIAREMGMTAPALYRYFPSHEELVTGLVVDIYDELGDLLEQAAARAGDDPARVLILLSRTFRSWAIGHPREFGLLFATPAGSDPDGDGTGAAGPPSPLDKAGNRFGAAFVGAFFHLWKVRRFPVPADDTLPPPLVEQLVHYRGELAGEMGDKVLELPLGAFSMFITCWVQLYGFVALEVFRHLSFCLTDAEPAFEANLRVIGRALGFSPEETAVYLP